MPQSQYMKYLFMFIIVILQKYGKDIKTARRDAAEKVAAAREPTIVRRVDNEIQPRVIIICWEFGSFVLS